MKNAIFDAINLLVTAIKTNEEHPSIKCVHNDKTYTMYSVHYLLGQLIRQIEVPKERTYISVKADELWKSITDEPIENYWYQKKVTCKNNGIQVAKYKGASKAPYDKPALNAGDNFVYKDVFHDEHVIPVNTIIEELIALESLDDDSIAAVLDKICICRILKEEDANIENRYKRPNTFEEVIRTTYQDAGIEVKDFKY